MKTKVAKQSNALATTSVDNGVLLPADAPVIPGFQTAIMEFKGKLPPLMLTGVNGQLFDSACNGVAKAAGKIKLGQMELGFHLFSIYKLIPQQFGSFAKTVMPTAGVSKSECYRKVAQYKELENRIPRHVINELVLIGDGRSIIVKEENEPDDEKGEHWTVSDSFKKALKKHPVPAKDASREDVQTWAAEVMSETNSLRASANRAKGTQGEGERILKVVINHRDRLADGITHLFRIFGDKFGAIEAQDLLANLDEIMQGITKGEKWFPDTPASTKATAKAA